MTIENQQTFPEPAEERIARFRRAIERWRASGYAYATLSPKGMAQPHRPGTLACLLHALQRAPGVRLVELAAPDAAATIIHWALHVAPQQKPTKEAN